MGVFVLVNIDRRRCEPLVEQIDNKATILIGANTFFVYSQAQMLSLIYLMTLDYFGERL